MTEDELSEVANWDADISALLGLLARAAETSRTVKLPDTLTASQLVALHKDEAEFVRALVRPMPRKPAPEAVRGTAFHAWVEDHYGIRKLANLEEPPPGSDSPIYDDTLLAKLKQAFTDGKFAQRRPLELEFPFALIVSARPLIGRIDAVFEGSIADPSAAKWTVVDWKTGAPGSADPLQLHAYRAAWAQHKNVPLEQVDAAFYFVGHDEIEIVTEIMTVEQLSELI
ncbi:MAG: PD-(D/E)XK nuclease family protein [Actinobacteria bacterium]|nr:PD-(D/E)XK nuclease family protein [Actinomycetota bacterium]